MPFDFHVSFGAKAPATPPPLPPAVEQKSGGNLEPFNRLVDMGSALERNPLNRPMAQSVWVMAAIKHISDPIGAVPLDFAMMDQDGSEKPYKNPSLAAFWADPAQNLSREEFIDATVGWHKLAGEVFFILDDSWLMRTVTKSKLIVARPAAMREIVDQQTDTLVGWEWMQANGRREVLIPDQVVHIKNWNPYNKWRGLAEMEAAKIAAESDYLQGRFAGNLARNNGDQGVYVVAKGNMPTEEQQRQIVMSLRMKRDAAMRGELRPLFLAGDISIEDPKIQTPDADFISQRLENRHEVAIAFKVPPSMFDVVASYSIGSASDRYRLIEDACIPTSQRYIGPLAKLSRQLLRLDPSSPLTCRFNFDNHSVMLQVRTERLAATDKLWTKGVPMKTCNDYLHLQLPEYPGWDIGYLPFNVAPVGEAADPVNDPALAEGGAKPGQDDEPDDAVEQLKSLFAQRGVVTVAKADDTANRRLWKKHMAQRMPTFRSYQAKINSALAGARSEMLAKLAAHRQMTGKSIVAKSGAGSAFMFNLHDFTAEFSAGMKQAAEGGYAEAGQQLYDEIGRDDPWVSPPARLKEFLAQRENKLRDVPQEIYDQVKRQLEAGIEAGETMKDLSGRVAGEFDTIKAGRARTIAMTETGAVYGSARQASMESAGIKYKRWLTSGNANVREAHQEAEGQIRALSEPYYVDGEEIDYPGDPEGAPENVINCHCVSIPEEDS